MIHYKNFLNFLIILSFIVYSNSCPPGTRPFLKSCINCKEGTYSPYGTSCYECPPGTYSSERGAVICDLCPPGSYNPSTGSTTCTKCWPGTYSRDYGSSFCYKCPYDADSDYGATSCYRKSFFDTLRGHLNNYNLFNNYRYY